MSHDETERHGKSPYMMTIHHVEKFLKMEINASHEVLDVTPSS